MLGGVGIAAMNGPAVMFCALVAIAVSTVSAVGNTPIPPGLTLPLGGLLKALL